MDRLVDDFRALQSPSRASCGCIGGRRRLLPKMPINCHFLLRSAERVRAGCPTTEIEMSAVRAASRHRRDLMESCALECKIAPKIARSQSQ